MSPQQMIMRDILIDAEKHYEDISIDVEITLENVDDLYNEILVEKDIAADFESEFREGQHETDIPCDWSRHYESKSVARKLTCGTWVGWTYWYGGGKHGEPEAMDWMTDSYFLDVTEKQTLMTVYSWSKRQPQKTGDQND